MHFLMGLNNSYSQLRSQIWSRYHFPSLSTIFSLVLQEERQHDLGDNLVVTLPSSPISSQCCSEFWK